MWSGREQGQTRMHTVNCYLKGEVEPMWASHGFYPCQLWYEQPDTEAHDFHQRAKVASV